MNIDMNSIHEYWRKISAKVRTQFRSTCISPLQLRLLMRKQQGEGSSRWILPLQTLLIALAVAFLAVTRRTRPKRGIIENNDDVKENMNARERDAARLEANRPKKKDKRSQKVAKEKEKKDFAKKVLNTIPYKKILSDDIFFLGKKMYSKAYTFDDINFNLSDEEQQYMYLERYIEFLSILDDTVDCQICCWNSQIFFISQTAKFSM